jgi:hypothetical protein
MSSSAAAPAATPANKAHVNALKLVLEGQMSAEVSERHKRPSCILTLDRNTGASAGHMNAGPTLTSKLSRCWTAPP